MSSKRIFVEVSASGHRIEYVQNIVNYIIANKISGVFFYLNPGFKNKVKGLDLISGVLYFSNYSYLSSGKNNKLVKVVNYYLMFRQVASFSRRNNIDLIVFLFLNEFYYFLFFTRLQSKISGIYFHTNYRKVSNISFRSRFKEMLLFKMAKSNKISRVFILNDESCARSYNEKTNSDVFSYLADPVVSFSGQESLQELKKLNNVYQIKKINVLHAGVLGGRKGTDIFVSSLNLLPKTLTGRFRFFLIGSPEHDFKNKLDVLINDLDNDIDFIFIPKFVSNSQLQAYIEFSDAVVLPYRNVESSSGMIVRSKIENKFIVAPALGLVGDLLKDYNFFIPMNSYDIDILPAIYERLLLNTESKNASSSFTSGFKSTLFFDNYVNEVHPDLFSKRLISNE